MADGAARYRNLTGAMEDRFHEVVAALHDAGITVWGWHVPHAADNVAADREADLVAGLADEFSLDGVLMDAEQGGGFFQGTTATARRYAKRLARKMAIQSLGGMSKGTAISSHDIPSNFPNFPFSAFAEHATVNAPQVYYGGSPSVLRRLDRAIDANAQLSIPFVPVGAGWIGPRGGCSSASACAERAGAFIELVRQHTYQGYSFWHWAGAPMLLWQRLFNTEA